VLHDGATPNLHLENSAPETCSEDAVSTTPPPRARASNHSFINPFPEVKPSETILRQRRAQLFPSAPFFLTYRILYAKALYPYQFSATSDRSSEVHPASSFIQRVKLTLRFAKGKVKTMALSITLCYYL
jgi:hypothetical protein